MAVDMTIKLSAEDNYSDAIATMQKANKNFTKDLTGLQSKLDAFNKTKYVLKGDTKKLRDELVAAEKQYGKNSTAANKLAVEMAQAKYENANRNLRLVSQNSMQAEKDMLGLADAAGKTEGVWKSIGSSGAFSMVGDVLQKVAVTQIGSAQGQEAGIIASSMLSTAAMGASIGTAIAPGIGTAIGALGGAVLGYIQGENTIFENKDNAFKSYYQNLYNGVLGEQSQILARGTGIASTREADKIPFSTLLGGDENANEFLDSLVEFATGTPFAYEELANISKDLLSSGYKQEELLPLFEKVGDTGAALGMKPEDMKSVAVALSHMQVTGETTMQDLNPLLERGIDVWSYLSEATGESEEKVKEMVNEGLIPGEEAAKAIADYMGDDYAGNMERQAKTYSGLISTLGDVQAEIDNAMGESYNSTREKGLQDQIDFLSGENGEEMQEAYKKIGQWKASLENLEEQYQRDAYSSVMSGTVSTEFSQETQERLAKMYEEYTKYAADGSEEAGAKMGALLAEAQAIAINEYNASDGAQLELETRIALAENIKNDTATKDAYWDAGYTMGQQFTMGLASELNKTGSNVASLMNLTPEEAAEVAGLITEKAKPSGIKTASNVSYLNDLTPEQIINGSYAYGLSYVPYDNYPALLHQGERVLTASENRSRGSGVQVSITGNSFTVRSEDDVEKIGNIVANKVARQMNQAFLLAN